MSDLEMLQARRASARSRYYQLQSPVMLAVWVFGLIGALSVMIAVVTGVYSLALYGVLLVAISWALWRGTASLRRRRHHEVIAAERSVDEYIGR